MKTPAANCTGIPEITQELKDLILDEHNKLRNQVAAGKLPRFQPATRMSTMVSLKQKQKRNSF